MRVAKALASAGAFVFALSGCYWLAEYQDLSSAYGDAGASLDASVVDAHGFCPSDAGALAYCMDFDHVDSAALPLKVSGANAGLVSSTSLSPPSSLLVTLQGNGSFGKYDVVFPFQPTTTRLEFAVQTVGLDEGVTTLAIALTEAATQTVRKLNVVMAQDGSFQVQEYLALADGGTAIGAHDWFHVDPGPATASHHVIMTLTVNDAAKRYASGLTVDDHVFEEGRALALPWAQGSVSLDIGVTHAATGNKGFFFDNVRADFVL